MNKLLLAHRDAGKFLQVGSTRAFVVDKGQGVPVVCLHGVPASSFLYRKVIIKIADNGHRGIAFDLLGMGLSDKPLDHKYDWTTLGIWSTRLLQILKLDKFHLILHDIGGPIGCEVISKITDQILSVTILNTPLIGLGRFTKPFPMSFFEKRMVGELFLAMTNSYTFKKLMHMRGVHQNKSFGNEAANAYVQLMKSEDGGRAFLKIMRSFEATDDKEAFYLSTLKNLKVPIQIIWGMNDPGLRSEKFGIPLQQHLGLDTIIETPGSHFLQEDYPDIIAEHVLQLV